MRFLGVLIAAVAAVAAQSMSVLEVFEALPSCGQTCLEPKLVALQCDISSLDRVGECLCTNVDALRDVAGCLFSNCNSTEQYIVSLANQQLCAGYPIPSRSSQLTIAVSVTFGIGLLFIGFRLFSRGYVIRSLGWDDLIIFICLIIILGCFPIILILSGKGFGKHIWNINLLEVPSILKLFYAIQLCYIAIQVLSKISVLCFYLRVFVQPWFRTSCYLLIAWLGLHGCVYLFITAFQCLPVSASWDPVAPAKCVDKMALIYSGAAFAIVEDIVIMVLPLPCISSLKLGWGRKVGVGLMFAVGSFSLVTSCVRLKFLKGFGDMSDPTWDNLNVVIWSEIEVFSAAICACIPALRPLVVYAMPNTFKSTKNTASFSTEPGPCRKPSCPDIECDGITKHERTPSEGVSVSERTVGTAFTSETAETLWAKESDASVEMLVFQKP